MNAVDIFLNGDVIRQSFPLLIRGFGMTLLLGFTSIVIGTLLGLALALVRLYAPKPFQIVAATYTDLIRATPVMVLLILIYYALPFSGLTLSSFAAATTALSMTLAAYSAEVMRAGLQAVPTGQFEAASSLGFGFWRSMQKVILPQAMRMIIPPQASNCVSLFKDTSLASVVAMSDMLKQANDMQALFANPTPLILAAIIYIAFLWPLVRLTVWLEHHYQKSSRR